MGLLLLSLVLLTWVISMVFFILRHTYDFSVITLLLLLSLHDGTVICSLGTPVNFLSWNCYYYLQLYEEIVFLTWGTPKIFILWHLLLSRGKKMYTENTDTCKTTFTKLEFTWPFKKTNKTKRFKLFLKDKP